MIINWERGKSIYGNSKELFEREIFNFVNIAVPKNTENAINYQFENKVDSLKAELEELKGSSNMICAEVLSEELELYLN